MPEPQADTMKNIAAIIRMARRPYLSARVPAKKAPTAQPSNMEETLKPVPIESELNAACRPSTVPLITPLSKPNKKPPIVAIQLIKTIKDVFPWDVFACSFMVIPELFKLLGNKNRDCNLLQRTLKMTPATLAQLIKAENAIV